MYKLLIVSFFLFLSQTLSALNVTVGSSGADYITDGTEDQIEIQQAIEAVETAGGGTVTLAAQTFNLTSRIIPRSHVNIKGTNKATTILSATHTFDYIFYTPAPTDNFVISDLTLNANNAQSSSGLRLEEVNNVVLKDLNFINMPCQGWHAVIGVPDADAIAGGTLRSSNIVLDNCLFDGHQGSLEMLLLYNTQDVTISNSTFQNKINGCSGGNRPVIGLWQFTDNTCIMNCIFQNNQSNECIYYSNTCNNSRIEGCTFNNTGAIKGANVSDHGDFGVDFATGLIIKDVTMVGGANDFDAPAVTIGAIDEVLIENVTITGYVMGIQYHDGYDFTFPDPVTGDPVSYELTHTPQHVAVVNTTIYDVNNTNSAHDIHPAIFYDNTALGDLYHFYVCGHIYDSNNTQDAPTRHTFSFYQVGQRDYIFNKGMHLEEAINYGVEFKLVEGATLGANFVNEQCDGMVSEPTYCTTCGQNSVSASDVFNRINEHSPTTATKINNLMMQSCPLSEAALPVELANFKLRKEEKTAVLTWETWSEKNFSHFDIERSSETAYFQKIGSVKGENIAATYNFIDNSPLREINNYRLKLVDLNGDFVYSKIKSLNFTSQNELLIFPNPTNNILNFKTNNNQSILVKISNLQGKIVAQNQGVRELTLSLKGMSRGMYFASISLGNERIIRKIILE